MTEAMLNLLPVLPVAIQHIRPLSTSFSDSTHLLYALTDHDRHVYCLKVLHNTQSPFWSAMQQVFDVDLKDQLGNYAQVYSLLSSSSALAVPFLVAASSQDHLRSAFILTRWLSGETVQSDRVSHKMVEQLSQHLASLHRSGQATWGNVFAADKPAAAWSETVRDCLLPFFAEDVAVLAFDAEPTVCVPMMLDLRWDQFLAIDDGLSALVDLDAFVYAPIELDFVLLEYVLSGEQLAIWHKAYVGAGGRVPSVMGVRDVYRKLLWSMQIYGDVPLSQWMAHPYYFV